MAPPTPSVEPGFTDTPPFPQSRTPSRPATIADRRAPLAAARRASGSRISGATVLWVFAAIVVFGLAAGLAFALNGDDDAAPATAVAAQPEAAQPEESAQSTATLAEAGTVTDNPAPAQQPTTESPPQEQQVPEPEAHPADVSPLLGFTIPIAGACVPESEALLPGSFRAYRDGTHEGVDFYSGAVGGCPVDLIVTLATPILAAKAGTVLRADWDYLNMTQVELDAAEAAGFQGEQILDRFRGRQVWIDHGSGIVTRYAHLSAIAAGLAVGQAVAAGQIIGFAGESGTPESVQAPGTDIHAHFEIRVGDGYLGEGLAIAEARRLYLEAFGVVKAASGG